MKWSGKTTVSVILLVVVVVLLAPVPVCRDWAYIDRNTGSQRGHREWIGGLQSGAWYHATALEKFMREKYPGELQHKWISYSGTSRGMLGRTLVRGHGRPGPIIALSPEVIDRRCAQMTDDQKRQLYDVLSNSDSEVVEELVNELIERDSASK